jgi:hypothetical protein
MGASDDHNRASSLPPLVRRRGGVAMADREEDPGPSSAPLVTGGFHTPAENSTPQDRMKPYRNRKGGCEGGRCPSYGLGLSGLLATVAYFVGAPSRR